MTTPFRLWQRYGPPAWGGLAELAERSPPTCNTLKGMTGILWGVGAAVVLLAVGTLISIIYWVYAMKHGDALT